MAADTAVPLTPPEYAVGRQVKHNDQTVTIRGAVTGDHGARFLLVTAGDSVVCGLIDESLIRDQFTAVDYPPQADPATTTPTDPAAAPAPGTGGTDGTGVPA